MNKTNNKIILALDTSTPVASVALAEFDEDYRKLLFSSMLNVGLTHSQTAAKLLKTTLDYTNIKPSDIDLYAVVNGPGSFTGLRIGIATIKAMADSQSKPMISVSSLETLAGNIKHTNGLIVPIIDARRTNVYGAVYNSDYKQIISQGIFDITELTKKVADISADAIFLGDGTARHADTIKGIMSNAQIADYVENMISAATALDIAIDKYQKGEDESNLVNYVKSTSAIPHSQQKKKW